MTTETQLRWKTEPLFIELLKLILNPEALPQGFTRREWFSKLAPKTICYATEHMDVDCRHLNFDGMSFGKSWLNYVLDYSSAVNATFERTGLQGASLKHCNFSGSRFIVAQMSPIYAYQANFNGCVFDRCFLMGTSPRNHADPWGVPVKAPFSDLRDCNFTGVKGHKTAFERCDFRGADLSHAHFTDCTFTSSDLIRVVLHGATFERCSFDRAWLDDTPEFRALVARGDNQNLDTIVWVDDSKR